MGVEVRILFCIMQLPNEMIFLNKYFQDGENPSLGDLLRMQERLNIFSRFTHRLCNLKNSG